MIAQAFYARCEVDETDGYTLAFVYPEGEYIYVLRQNAKVFFTHLVSVGTFNLLVDRVIIIDKNSDRRMPFNEFKARTIARLGRGYSLLALIGLPTHHSKLVSFQTPATPIMEGIVDLHHDIMFFLTFIVVFVLYLLVQVIIN